MGLEEVKTALERLRGEKCLITFHSSADLDSCTSALALKHYLGDGAIVCMQDRINHQSKIVLKEHLITIKKFSDADDEQKKKIIVVDCNTKNLLHMIEGRVYMVIDHHAKDESSISSEFEWIAPEACSTAQMVCGLIEEKSPLQARLLILGILSDSANLAWADSHTFDSLSELLRHSDWDYERIRDELRSQQSFDSRAQILEGLTKSGYRHEGGLIASTAFVGANEAQIADELVHAGADVAFICSNDSDGRYRLSARMRTELIAHVDLSIILKKVAKEFEGESGGHPAAAALNGAISEDPKLILDRCVHLFFEHTVVRIKV